jgi:hypothetical protein
MENMRFWEKLKSPPETALKKISGGRLNGKTDISPQWRYMAMTNLFGPCGIGWKFTIDRTWQEKGDGVEVFAFAQVSVQIRDGEKWSDPIPGLGGSLLVEKENRGPHNNDEGYKMAVTDALGTAMKMFGVAADGYMGLHDSKYGRQQAEQGQQAPAAPQQQSQPPQGQQAPCNGATISEPQGKRMFAIAMGAGWTTEDMRAALTANFGIVSSKDIPKSRYEEICAFFQNKGATTTPAAPAKDDLPF